MPPHHSGADERDRDRRRVEQVADGEPARPDPDLLGADLDPELLAAPGRGDVGPERAEADAHQGHRDAVDGRRRLFVLARLQVLGEQGGREGDEDDREEQQQVDEEHDAVGAGQVVDHRVVVDPDDPDHPEADREGGERGPLVAELAPQVLAAGDVELEHQQRDRDREDAVAERLQAVGGHSAR
jgi:hypothetical protein